MQRSFPWLSIMPAPIDAQPQIVGLCHSAQDALNASLIAKGSNFTASWFAQRLGVSSAYLSQLRHGVKRIPEWMVGPLCYLTGTNLLQQYIDLQTALREVRRERTERERIAAVARELRVAA